jgi:hypothetical protein
MDPGMGGGGPGLSPDVMAALSGGGPPGADTNSTDLLGEGPLAGEDTGVAEESAGDTPVDKVRQAVQLLREAGMDSDDDVMSHAIDKAQADLQKLLSGEKQKVGKLTAALSG